MTLPETAALIKLVHPMLDDVDAALVAIAIHALTATKCYWSRAAARAVFQAVDTP